MCGVEVVKRILCEGASTIGQRNLNADGILGCWLALWPFHGSGEYQKTRKLDRFERFGHHWRHFYSYQ